MTSLLEYKYVFTTIPRIQHSNVYELQFDPYFMSKHSRMAPEIYRLKAWDKMEFNFNGSIAHIRPVVNSELFVKPEMIFHHQEEGYFFGEDVETGKAIYASLYGPTDENGIIVPIYVELQISRFKFNNINVFNYPSFGSIESWDAALDAKWKRVGELVRAYHL